MPEYPHYTRPPSYRGWEVPEVLLSGDHEKVRQWRLEQSRRRAEQFETDAGVATIPPPRGSRTWVRRFFLANHELRNRQHRARPAEAGLPSFAPGDRVRVHFQVIEGNRKRTQVFEGVVLERQGSGVRETFTVRKQSFGVGVERTFPLHSPKIEKLEVAARGDVRRAKLYYLRGRIGKAARVAERRWGIDDDVVAAPAAGDEPARSTPRASARRRSCRPRPRQAEAEAPRRAEETRRGGGGRPRRRRPRRQTAAEPRRRQRLRQRRRRTRRRPRPGRPRTAAAPEDAEDEEPAEAGDSDEDSAA